MNYRSFGKFFSAILICFAPVLAKAQLIIDVPTSSDTVICDGAPLTLHAVLTATTTATTMSLSVDDGYSSSVPIGFTFDFYGTTYTSCVISSNGYITFNASDASGYSAWSIGSGIPTNTNIENSFCGVYSDIYPAFSGGGGTITYSTMGTAPYRKFVVTFCNNPMYSCTSQLITFQMMLYETTNVMECHIGHKEICSSWNGGYAIQGVENASGTAGVAAPGRNYPDTWTATHDGRRFTPDSGFTTYTVDTIPYNPAVDYGATIYWFDGSTYLGSGDSITVSPSTPTTYTALAASCADTSFANVTVTIGTGPAISAITTTDPTVCGACDGTITLHGIIPFQVDTITYEIDGVPQPPVIDSAGSDSLITLTGLCAGTYSNFVAKVGYCASPPAGPVTLTNPPLVIRSVTFTNPHCLACDGTITLMGLPPSEPVSVSYDLGGVPQPPVTGTTGTDSTISLTGLCEGTYDNIVVTMSICTSPAVGPVVLSEPPPIVISSVSYSNPTTCGACDGIIRLYGLAPGLADSVFYTIGGLPQPPLVITSSGDSSITLGGLCKGIYNNIYVKVNGCPSNIVGPYDLMDPPILPGFTFDTSHLGCHGDTVLFTNTSTSPGALYFTWSFGDGSTDTSYDPTHIYMNQGVYTVLLTVTNHVCVDSIAETVTLIHPVKSVFSVSPDTICQRLPVTFTNSSIGTDLGYLWAFGDGTTDTANAPSHTFDYSGAYKVRLIVHDYVPCYDTSATTVFVDTLSGVDFTANDTVFCEGQRIMFDGIYAAEGNTGIVWAFGDGYGSTNTNPVDHAYDMVGLMPVKLTANYRACPDTSVTHFVRINPYPAVNIGADTSLCPGSGAITIIDQVNAANPKAHWLWSTNDTTAGITVDQPGYYSTTVTIDGCSNSDTIWVKNDCYMDIPNAFTPNGDGVNDYFFPRQFLSAGVITFKMDIYNRWGQQIFETTNADGRGWDGKLNGTDQPEGVYIYIIDATFKNGVKEHHQGNVTLLR